MYRYKIALLVILCLALCGQAHAQRYLPGQKGIQVTAGAVDGFRLGKQDGQAFCFGLAIATCTKKGNRWVFGGEYLQKNHRYGDRYIPVSQFTGEAGHYFKFLSDKSKTFFLSLGASILGGYETVNYGKKLLGDGTTIQNKDNFLYGGAISFETEIFISDRFALLINARERILGGSSVNMFHTQIGVGVRVMIN